MTVCSIVVVAKETKNPVGKPPQSSFVVVLVLDLPACESLRDGIDSPVAPRRQFLVGSLFGKLLTVEFSKERLGSISPSPLLPGP